MLEFSALFLALFALLVLTLQYVRTREDWTKIKKTDNNMKIAIFGATGIVGKSIVSEALKQGHQVTALTRDASKITLKDARLKVVEGDVTDRITIRQVLEGQEAVIQTLGIGGKGDGGRTTFVSEVNSLIMEEMERMNIHRLVAISVIGAGDSLLFLPWIYRKCILPLFQRWFIPIIEDKNRMESQILQSRMDWTVIRCTTVQNKPAMGKVNATLDGRGVKFTITAPDMAAFFIEELGSRQFLRKMPTISN